MSEWGWKIILFCCMLAAVSAVGAVAVFLLTAGGSSVFSFRFLELLFGIRWAPTDVPPSYGIFPFLSGTGFTAAGALLLAGPRAVLAAGWLSRFCPDALVRPFTSAIDLLAGIPPVLYGFWGMMVIVPFIQQCFGGTGNSVLAASVVLAVMIIPSICEISTSAIRAVPEEYYQAARALGISREKAVFRVVLPAAASGIAASLVLAMGRAAGETLAVVMTAGNQAWLPSSPLEGVRTLAAHIFLEMSYASENAVPAFFSAGVVLFILILSVNVGFFLLRRKLNL